MRQQMTLNKLSENHKRCFVSAIGMLFVATSISVALCCSAHTWIYACSTLVMISFICHLCAVCIFILKNKCIVMLLLVFYLNFSISFALFGSLAFDYIFFLIVCPVACHRVALVLWCEYHSCYFETESADKAATTCVYFSLSLSTSVTCS